PVLHQQVLSRVQPGACRGRARNRAVRWLAPPFRRLSLMTTPHFSDRVGHLRAMNQDLGRFITGSTWAKRAWQPGICDFVLGTPQERVHPGFVSALTHHSTPQSVDWFAYKDNEQASREHIARTLRAWRGLPFEEDDIFLTNG